MQHIKNSYGRCQIIDLNMMREHHDRGLHVSPLELLLFLTPLLVVMAALCLPSLSDMTFFAQCQNVPGGDVCSISFDKA